MIDLKEIIFAPFNLSIAADQMSLMLEEHQQKVLKSFYSQYRTCRMIPLRTSLGSLDPKIIANKNHIHEWTSNIESMPVTKRVLEESFLPLVGQECRIITLCTPPRSSVKVHYDCTESTFDEIQLKMRLVLTGHFINSLWFLGPQNEKLFSHSESPAYVLSGAHPHGAMNDSDQEKMTICLGGKFQGVNQELHRYLEQSYLNYSQEWITHKNVPKRFIPELFQEKYEILLKSGHIDDRLGIDL